MDRIFASSGIFILISIFAIGGLMSAHGQSARSLKGASSSSLGATSQSSYSASLPRVFAPTQPRTTYTRYSWKRNIVTTVFWIGETATSNNPTPNNKSSWDGSWQSNYGGYDDPDPSNRDGDFTPKKFAPGQNPFYVALPYNDLVNWKTTKSSAKFKIPWFKQRFEKGGKSVCKGQWIAIRSGSKVCFAQWEDCGPFETDDHGYVFGNSRPRTTKNGGAGLDVSPAVRDYLGLKSGEHCDWRFVDLEEISMGPWAKYGTNNHFVQLRERQKAAQQERIAKLREMRDAWLRDSYSSYN
jgi:hypothetical protein